MSSLLVTFNIVFLKDVDECSVNSDVCGFGTCINNPNGEFYMCECEDGAMLGTNSDNLPTCFGMLLRNLLPLHNDIMGTYVCMKRESIVLHIPSTLCTK